MFDPPLTRDAYGYIDDPRAWDLDTEMQRARKRRLSEPGTEAALTHRVGDRKVRIGMEHAGPDESSGADES